MNKLKKKAFINKYFKEFLTVINLDDKKTGFILELSEKILKTKKNKGTVFIFGNGGSSSTASHIATDLVKNAGINSLSLHDTAYLTCLTNDYGYDKWIKKSIEYHIDKKDLIILISSSGNSPNMIEAAKEANKRKIPLYTLTGMKKNNFLSKISKNNFWINSKSYNFVENAHMFMLMAVVDLIIGKYIYPAK